MGELLVVDVEGGNVVADEDAAWSQSRSVVAARV